MENCSSGLLGVIVRNTFHFIPVVPLLALKIRKDLSEIASWLGPTKKGMGLFGHCLGRVKKVFSRKRLEEMGFEPMHDAIFLSVPLSGPHLCFFGVRDDSDGQIKQNLSVTPLGAATYSFSLCCSIGYCSGYE
ncbi:hypothetical protein L1887_47282 [Cichorium endivia]|nr:hypothetical protein L1887_47282 [Cichorium endivia]